MAADKPERKEKKDKKRSDESGVSKSKKEKKEKKDKKEKLAAALEDKLQKDAAAQSAAAAVQAVQEAVGGGADSDSDMEDNAAAAVPIERTVVPFAVPLADDKGQKKVYKAIRKAAKNNSLKRGVKEVVKTLRKSAPSGPGNTSFPGIVIIAGDISPQDVISHLPVLCEDHNVPFIFVTSRAELGAAAKTKRPTSVVMIMEKRDGKKKAAEKEADDGEEYSETYTSLAKFVQKEYSKQSFWSKGESQA